MNGDFTAFDLLLGELQASCEFTPLQRERLRVVFSSWSRQVLRVPSSRRWLLDTAVEAARRMDESGQPTALMRDRLMALGVGRTTAYKIIAQVRGEEMHDGAR